MGGTKFPNDDELVRLQDACERLTVRLDHLVLAVDAVLNHLSPGDAIAKRAFIQRTLTKPVEAARVECHEQKCRQYPDS
jgi:hypothetical protein